MSAAEMTMPLVPPFVPPARKRVPFPGNILMLRDNMLATLPEAIYREPMVETFGPPRVIHIADPALVKEVLLDRADEFRKDNVMRHFFRDLLGNGIFTAEGQDWRWQRRTAAPLFRHGELLRYVPTMSDAADAVIAKWRAAPEGAVHAIDGDMMQATYHVISNTILAGGGSGVGEAILEGRDDYIDGVNWWLIYSLFRMPHWMPRPGGRRMRAQEARLRASVTALIRDRRAAVAEGRQDDRDDIFTRMLTATDPETGQAMSESQLVDNLLTFLLAGYETTATSLTWTLYLLSKSPEWAERAYREVMEVAPSGPIGAGDVERLVVVQQVLKEAMRLFPAAAMMQRCAQHNTRLGDVPVKRGTLISVPVYAIHRHRRLWSDPDTFDPSRFAPEQAAHHARYQFMPFGAGPRVCIGGAFAMIEATVILAQLIRAAEFSCPPGFEPEPVARITLAPRNGMPLHVTMRD